MPGDVSISMVSFVSLSIYLVSMCLCGLLYVLKKNHRYSQKLIINAFALTLIAVLVAFAHDTIQSGFSDNFFVKMVLVIITLGIIGLFGLSFFYMFKAITDKTESGANE